MGSLATDGQGLSLSLCRAIGSCVDGVSKPDAALLYFSFLHHFLHVDSDHFITPGLRSTPHVMDSDPFRTGSIVAL